MNQDITPSTYQPSGQTPAPNAGPSPATSPAPSAPQQPTGQVIPLQSGPKRSKGKAVLLVLLFLLLLAAIGGVYYWQHGKYDSLATAKTAADKQIVSLQSQLNAKTTAPKATTPTPAAATPNYNVVTGNVTTQAATTASISALYKPGSIDEIWLEYGTTPDKLATATPHITQGLGAGDANTYAQQIFKVTGLTAGQNYFYHVAAKSKGATVYGGTASFTAVK